MSSTDRRVLAGLLGALLGVVVVGGLLTVAHRSGSDLDAVYGPVLGLLVALLVVRFAPVGRARTDEE
jgi:hypothetical protein